MTKPKTKKKLWFEFLILHRILNIMVFKNIPIKKNWHLKIENAFVVSPFFDLFMFSLQIFRLFVTQNNVEIIYHKKKNDNT